MTTTEILTGIKNWVVGKLTLKQDVINDLASIRSGAQAGSTSVQPADILSYFDNAAYDSGTHRINFYHGQSVIAYIDASPFIVDGMVDDVRIENGYLVIDFNTASGKQDISIPLTDIFDPSNYYNKTQTDTLLGNKVDKVTGKGLSTNDYTNAEKEKLSGLQNYDDTQVRQLIGQKQDIIQDLEDIRSGAGAGATAVQPSTLNSALSDTVAESGVYDVTANNNNAKFASLSALLNSENLDTLIPSAKRKGGMSIKFVLSSDNKYIQARCMAQNFTTDVTQWQSVDDEPIEDSNNLIKSCAVAIIRDLLIGDNYTDVELISNTGFVRANGTIAPDSVGFYTNPISVSKNTAVIITTSAINVFSAVSEYNNGFYTPIYLGKSSDVGIPSTYTFVASRDMQIVISGYSTYFSKTICKSLNFTNYTALKNITDYISELTTAVSNNKMPAGYIPDTTGIFSDVHTFPVNKFYQAIGSNNVANKPSGVAGFSVYTFGSLDEGNIKFQILTDKNKNLYISAYWGTNGWSDWLKLNDLTTLIGTTLPAIQNSINNQQKAFDTTNSWMYGNTTENIQLSSNTGYIRDNGTIKSHNIGYYTSPISLNKNDVIIFYTCSASVMSVLSEYNNGTYKPLMLGKGNEKVFNTYTFVADKDMQVVVSGYATSFNQTTCIKIVYSDYTALKNIVEDINKLYQNDLNFNDLDNYVISAFDNIVSVGDSLTYSQVYTADHHSRQAYSPWPKVVKKIAGLENYDIFARSGGTSKTIWDAFKDSFAVPATGKTLCTIYLGTNNWFEDTIDTSAPAADVENYRTAWADDYTGCMCKIIQTFINLGAKIILIRPFAGGIYPRGEVPSGWTLADTNEVIRKIAARFNIPYVDSANFAPSDIKYHYYPDLSGSNGLHMNDLGYACFAGKFITEVDKLSNDMMKLIIPQ